MRFFLSLIFLILIILFPAQVSSQVLLVRDRLSNAPIEKMALYTPSLKKYAVSDDQGRVSLDAFLPQDTIIFQHQSYQKIIRTKEEILKQSLILYFDVKTIWLEPSVVAASHWEENRREIPNQIEKINARQISLYNPQTSADLLGKSDRVFIQKSQLGGGSPMIRGFAANAVLIVVDGIRMNNAIFRSGNLQNIMLIDANAVQSAEIIFGPGTVIYGSDALGGVMDFHSLHPSLSTSNNPVIRVHSLIRYASANHEQTGHVDVTFGTKKISSVTSFTWSSFDDLRMGNHQNPDYQRVEYATRITGKDTVISNAHPNVQKPSGYHQVNFLQKIRYRPLRNVDMTFALHYSTSSDIPRYDRLIQYDKDHLVYADWYYGPQQWLMPVLSVELNKGTRLYDHVKINTAYQYMTESRHDRKFDNTLLRHRKEKVNAGTLSLDFEKTMAQGDRSIYYGVETTYNDVQSTGKAEDLVSGTFFPVAPRYPDGFNHYYSLAAYTRIKQHLSDKFTLNIGARLNRTGLHSLIRDTSFYHFPFSRIDMENGTINGALGMVYHPNARWQYNINLSSGFRAPNLDDAGKVFDSEPGKVIVPNERLKPEYLYNIDMGILCLRERGFSFEITGFASYLDNAMVRRPFTFNAQDSIYYDGRLSEVQALTNTGYAILLGGSLAAKMTISEHLSFQSVLTVNSGKDDEGFSVRHTGPLYGATHIIWESNKTKIDLYSRYNGEIPYQRLAPSERSKPYLYATDNKGNPYAPSWATFNLMTSFTLPFNLQLQAGIENILNLRYRPYSSGITGPGRNLVIALRYSGK